MEKKSWRQWCPTKLLIPAQLSVLGKIFYDLTSQNMIGVGCSRVPEQMRELARPGTWTLG
jgi:hypothetical protein